KVYLEVVGGLFARSKVSDPGMGRFSSQLTRALLIAFFISFTIFSRPPALLTAVSFGHPPASSARVSVPQTPIRALRAGSPIPLDSDDSSQWEVAGTSLVTALASYGASCIFLSVNFPQDNKKSVNMAVHIDAALQAHSAIVLRLSQSGAILSSMRNRLVSPLHRIPEVSSEIFRQLYMTPKATTFPITQYYVTPWNIVFSASTAASITCSVSVRLGEISYHVEQYSGLRYRLPLVQSKIKHSTPVFGGSVV
ncbi:hypothetical protein FRC11_002020, partial [Ceratobasidium sp. 423]